MLRYAVAKPPIILPEEEDVIIPNDFLEEVVASAVTDAATTTTSPQHHKPKKRKQKKSASAPSSAKKRKRITPPICNVTGCTNQSQNGRVCIRHGAPWKKKQCSVDDCTRQAINGGVCRRHGAKVKQCSKEGCNKLAKLGGACAKHSDVKRCRYDCGRCLNEAKSWGLCARHGGLVGLCYYKGCINQTFWGLCHLHGGPEEDFCCVDGCPKCLIDDGEESGNGDNEKDEIKLCFHRGCINLVDIGGVCVRHSDEAYQYPLCQPCDTNKVHSNVDGEKASDGKEATHSPKTNQRRGKRASKATKRDAVKNAVCSQVESTTKETASSLQASGRRVVAATRATKNVRTPLRMTKTSTILGDSGHNNIAGRAVKRKCGEKDERHCVLDGCFRYVLEEGGLYCKRHKDTKETSEHNTNQTVPKRNADTAAPPQQKPRPAKPICNHEGCNNKASKSGFCSSHKPKIVHKRCSHEGCTRFAKGKGVCITHGATVQRKLCSVDGCKNQAKRRRVCKKHGAYDDALFVG